MVNQFSNMSSGNPSRWWSRENPLPGAVPHHSQPSAVNGSDSLTQSSPAVPASAEDKNVNSKSGHQGPTRTWTSLFKKIPRSASSAGRIKLTKDTLGSAITHSTGRAVYKQEVILWDEKSRELADFTTHFSFVIKPVNDIFSGDGLTFFLAKYTPTIPDRSGGGLLGLYGNKTKFGNPENGVVAVEFDTFQNAWDPNANHIGIDVNSVVSNATVSWNSSMKDGRTANAWVTYNSTTKKLSVFLTYDINPICNGNSSLTYNIDLRDFLPSKVAIGFSASTGLASELHEIISWSFSSKLEEEPGKPEKTEKPENPEKMKVGLIVGLSASFGTILILVSGVCIIYSCKKVKKQEDSDNDEFIDNELEKDKGLQRYTFNKLVAATNNFAVKRRIGEGRFGKVYKGVLNNEEIAIKRFPSGCKQGKKEYISEVRIISRLRHRNLVQLVGWCHKQREFLLVYKYMTNGNLESHLYYQKKILSWPIRYNIALSLASALLYLHEEWEQCVVHRDIKPSNVMLDSWFEAKLGDFGLARLVGHEIGSQTTILAGTMGYLAPESVTTGNARKESDVYSFGVVALEIACGKKPMVFGNVDLVHWVWELHGKGMILEAVDQRLGIDFDQDEIERLMIVGLWCAHPDHVLRPSIRQAISVLKIEAPLPSLPPTMPVPKFVPSGFDMMDILSTDGLYSASTATSSNATQSPGSSATSLLKSYRADV